MPGRQPSKTCAVCSGEATAANRPMAVAPSHERSDGLGPSRVMRMAGPLNARAGRSQLGSSKMDTHTGMLAKPDEAQMLAESDVTLPERSNADGKLLENMTMFRARKHRGAPQPNANPANDGFWVPTSMDEPAPMSRKGAESGGGGICLKVQDVWLRSSAWSRCGLEVCRDRLGGAPWARGRICPCRVRGL